PVAMATALVPSSGCYRGNDGGATTAADHGGSGTHGTSATHGGTTTGGTSSADASGTANDTTGGPEQPGNLEVVLLVTPDTEAAHQPWFGLFTQAGFSVTTDHSLAGLEPTQSDLDELAELYDLALVT